MLMAVSTELEQKSLKFVWKHKRSQIRKAILKKENGAGEVRFCDLRLHYKALVIKTVCYWQKNRNIDQWNRIENTKISPCTYSQLIYDKRDKTMQCLRDSLFDKWCWESWTVTYEK